MTVARRIYRPAEKALESYAIRMFFNIQPTPYDVRFRVLGIPVCIHPSYWLVSALFAWSLAKLGIQFWFIGIGCMFLSLMVHELGHALMFRYYGVASVIFLYSFGGLAIPEGRVPKRSQRIIVALAGPTANFLLAGLVWGSNYIEPWTVNLYALVIFSILFSINLYWGLLNLLPVWPLDGGQVARELFQKYNSRDGLVKSLQLSVAVAIAFVIYALACEFELIPLEFISSLFRPGIFAAVIFAMLAFQNYTELQNTRRMPGFSRQDDDDRPPWR